MTMSYKIILGERLFSHRRNEVSQMIGETFREVDIIYNKWNPESEISKLNRSSANQKISLSIELEQFLLETDHLISLSRGRFDPTVEAIQKVWKKQLNRGQTPSDEEIREVSAAVGWKHLHFENGFFWKDHDLLEIDLGGIAKGYAIDLIVKRLNAQGYRDVYVEWGGEIRTSGKHPEGRPWRIFISSMGSPDPSKALAIVEMGDQAVASSGDYLQNWTVDEVTYFHIFNPKTLCPLIATDTTVCSATVITHRCMIADFLATTAMLFSSPEEAKEWLEELKTEFPDLQYWTVGRRDYKTI